jgi:hypothetical protein
MNEIIEDGHAEQFANRQSDRELRASSNTESRTPIHSWRLPCRTDTSDWLKASREQSARGFFETAVPEEVPPMEAIDGVEDFLRVVDRTNRSEISARGCDRRALKQTSSVLNRNLIAIPLMVVGYLGIGD